MNKKDILNEMIKAGILSENDAQIVHFNIHQLDKLAKTDTPEQKKILNTLRFELLKIIFAGCVLPPEKVTPPPPPKPRTPLQSKMYAQSLHHHTTTPPPPANTLHKIT